MEQVLGKVPRFGALVRLAARTPCLRGKSCPVFDLTKTYVLYYHKRSKHSFIHKERSNLLVASNNIREGGIALWYGQDI